MSAAAGPDIVTDGLVFKYDTGDGKSYRGEPTENLVPSGDRTASTALARQSYHQETWSYSLLTNTLGRADIIRLYIDPSGNTSQPYADFGFNAYKSGGSQVGDVYTITFDYYVAKNTNTPSCIIAYQNGYKSPSSASVATFGSETTVDLGDGWKRVTRTATITTAGNTWWRFGLNSDNNETEVYLDNFQVELKSHATPFVDGTRSATQGLLDRTGNSTIDLSDVSFDSNAQMTFDGTDDYIALPSDLRSVFTSYPNCMECVLKKSSDDQGDMVVFDVDITRWNLNYNMYVSNQWSFDFYDGTEHYIAAGNYDDEYVHFVLQQLSNGTMQIYANGVLKGSQSASNLSPNGSSIRIGSRSNGDSRYFKGELPLLRVYNKALTAAQVLQNFNATKSRFGL